MDTQLLHGALVRLAPVDPTEFARVVSAWGRQSDYWRLMAADPAHLYSAKSVQTWLEKNLESKTAYPFAIRALEDDRLIGDIGLDGVQWTQGDTFVGISIGVKELWGKGYGSDAMRVILRFAFLELNLHRVSLNVFEYNPRAIRSYEKVGFVHEGRARHFLNREGQRYDLIYMGILREDWLAANPA